MRSNLRRPRQHRSSPPPPPSAYREGVAVQLVADHQQLPETIAGAAASLAEGHLSSRELVDGFLDRVDRLQPQLNCFITVAGPLARAAADRLDRERKADRARGPLHGIPLAYKDTFDTAGIRTTVGSAVYRRRVPVRGARVVQRLEASGAIPLGKTNMNEFSSGLTGHNEHYGPVRNPWALERSPGGSSGGSAVAVAAGLCLGALGTDAGCSVRVPAAWTGVVGLRPTWGRIDLQGAFPRAPSLDAAGFLARGVADVALLSCLAMGRPAEQATETARLCLQSRRQGVSGVRVSVIEDFTFGVGDRDLDDRVASAIALMETAGCVVDAVDASWLPRLAHDDAALDLLFREFSDVMNAALGSELAGAPLGHDVRADLRLGANVSDQRYRDLLAERRRYDALVDSLFERVDIIVTPTCHFVPPRLDDGKEAFASGRFHCMPFSMLGLPAISVPIGLSDDHLPVGLQLVSARGSDDRLLTVAAALEGVLDATGDKKERTDAHGL